MRNDAMNPFLRVYFERSYQNITFARTKADIDIRTSGSFMQAFPTVTQGHA